MWFLGLNEFPVPPMGQIFVLVSNLFTEFKLGTNLTLCGNANGSTYTLYFAHLTWLSGDVCAVMLYSMSTALQTWNKNAGRRERGKAWECGGNLCIYFYIHSVVYCCGSGKVYLVSCMCVKERRWRERGEGARPPPSLHPESIPPSLLRGLWLVMNNCADSENRNQAKRYATLWPTETLNFLWLAPSVFSFWRPAFWLHKGHLREMFPEGI